MEETLKAEIIKQLMEEGNLKTSEDISEFFLDMQSRLYQCLLESELDIHLAEKDTLNKRNGYAEKPREVKTKVGTKVVINMPRDRNGSFNPIIIKKRQRVVDDFSDLAILLYSKGNTLEDIKAIIKHAYKIDLSSSFISELISKVSEDVVNWQNRPLPAIYAMTYIDCLYATVKVEGFSKKVAVYVIIGIGLDGKKEVVGTWIGDGSESATYWCGILNSLKERGVEDILYMSIDGLSGLEESIEEVFPLTKVQRCIVHITRNIYKVCNKKDSKEVINDFKKINKSSNLEEAKLNYELFLEAHKNKPAVIKKAINNIDYIFKLFSETEEVRRLIYTTNAIESVNSCLRKVTNGKGMFMNKESLLRVLYLRIQDLEKKWSKGTKGWEKIQHDLLNQYGDRIKKYL